MARLLDELRTAEPGTETRIEEQIYAEWSKSGSAAVDLLFQRGQDALEAGDWVAAAEHLTAAADHAPDFAEAYHMRATAYYMLGQVGPALADLAHALDLNPDNFRALQGFAVILEEMGRPEDALEVWRRVAAIHPADAGIAGSVERLELSLGGRTL